MESADYFRLILPAYGFVMTYLAGYVISSRRMSLYLSLFLGALALLADHYLVPQRAPWFTIYAGLFVIGVSLLSIFALDVRRAVEQRLG
jgi:hypothetical protein